MIEFSMISLVIRKSSMIIIIMHQMTVYLFEGDNKIHLFSSVISGSKDRNNTNRPLSNT